MKKWPGIPGMMGLALASFQAVADTGTASRLPGLDPLQTSLSLLLVLLIIIACLLLLRRYGSFTPVRTRQVRVLATLPLGQRERIVVVEAGQKQLVLGVCPGRIETLCILEGVERLITEPDTQPSPDFMNTLQQILQQRSK